MVERCDQCSPLIGRRANFSRILVETIKKLQGKVDTVMDTGPGQAAGARGLELGTENPDIPGVSSKVESWIMPMKKTLVRVSPW